MTREIKFRAWDKDGERMVYLEPYLYLNYKGKFEYVDGPDLETSERDYPVMQFTGLHDKNGKEIYEGDIVQAGYSGDTGTIKNGVIEWMDMGGGLGIGFYLWDCDTFKVIGNIYENPKLLPTNPQSPKV